MSTEKPAVLQGQAIKRAKRELEKHPRLDAIYKGLKKKRAAFAQVEAEYKYAVGEAVNTVKDTATYGSRAVETLAVLLSYDPSTIHDYAGVAQNWKSWDEVDDILRETNAVGQPLTFSHLIELNPVHDPRDRSAYLRDARREGWSVRQLREAIHGDSATGQAEWGPDVTIQRVAAAWMAEADQLRNRAEIVIQLAKKAPTAAALAGLSACAEQQRAIAKQAEKNATELDTAITELRGRKRRRRSS